MRTRVDGFWTDDDDVQGICGAKVTQRLWRLVDLVPGIYGHAASLYLWSTARNTTRPPIPIPCATPTDFSDALPYLPSPRVTPHPKVSLISGPHPLVILHSTAILPCSEDD